ncbi:MAG TPA: hypothetical protein VE967_05425 [Gemmatimonadaceae bacterium]|nr:hypothetical protein [Gemmatimonadaceae bacterium]
MAGVRVFVNGKALECEPGATALDAVAQADRKEAEEVHSGRRMIVDSRGIAVSPYEPVFAGAIFRTLRQR